MSFMRAWTAACFYWAAIGCSSEIQHSAPAPICDPAVSKCMPAQQIGGGSGSGGAASDAGTSTGVEDLTGTVVVYGADDFIQTGPFQRPAVIRAFGAGAARVTGNWDG